jgi:predicted nucleotidyltransferase component of viral defense system
VIPVADISEWRQVAPWSQDAQVEQDLVLTRAVVTLFSHPVLARELAFRGGTALFKLHVKPAARYSEDIDLVQLRPGPIGPVLDALRETLDPWLGKAKQTTKEGRVVLVYRFQSEGPPAVPLRLKVEINTREHVALFGIETREMVLASRWASGSAAVPTFALDELLGTKLRALYQRKKGRDLFDLFVASRRTEVDPVRVVECFQRYLEMEGRRVTRAEFEQNLHGKL